MDSAYALRQHDLAASGDFAACQAFWARAVDLYGYMLNQRDYIFDELAKEVARLAGRTVGAGERLPLRRPGSAHRAQLRPLMAQAGLPVSEVDD